MNMHTDFDMSIKAIENSLESGIEKAEMLLAKAEEEFEYYCDRVEEVSVMVEMAEDEEYEHIDRLYDRLNKLKAKRRELNNTINYLQEYIEYSDKMSGIKKSLGGFR